MNCPLPWIALGSFPHAIFSVLFLLSSLLSSPLWLDSAPWPSASLRSRGSPVGMWPEFLIAQTETFRVSCPGSFRFYFVAHFCCRLPPVMSRAPRRMKLWTL